jgi:hypothetical protein
MWQMTFHNDHEEIVVRVENAEYTVVYMQDLRDIDPSALPESYFRLNFGTFAAGDEVEVSKVNQTWIVAKKCDDEKDAAMRMWLRLVRDEECSDDVVVLPN